MVQESAPPAWQDSSSAEGLTLASYFLPWALTMTSGARYAAVPTRVSGADCRFSSCKHDAGLSRAICKTS